MLSSYFKVGPTIGYSSFSRASCTNRLKITSSWVTFVLSLSSLSNNTSYPSLDMTPRYVSLDQILVLGSTAKSADLRLSPIWYGCYISCLSHFLILSLVFLMLAVLVALLFLYMLTTIIVRAFIVSLSSKWTSVLLIDTRLSSSLHVHF
jgi:hypothetical protein